MIEYAEYAREPNGNVVPMHVHDECFSRAEPHVRMHVRARRILNDSKHLREADSGFSLARAVTCG
jgi:hypothetical protein